MTWMLILLMLKPGSFVLVKDGVVGVVDAVVGGR